MKNPNQNLENINNISHSDKVKRAEILATLFAEHNIAFSTD